MYINDKSKKIYLDEVNGEVILEENFVILNNKKKYYLRYLSEDGSHSRGGNSSVFVLYDKEGIEEDKVIKFCTYHKPNRYTHEWIKKRYGRFITEIQALKEVNEYNNCPNIIAFFEDGTLEIDGKWYSYYVMEKADSNLRDYLLNNPQNIDFIEKIKLFRDIFNGIKSLHELGYYHRDIKPDNILLFYLNDATNENERRFTWKIGDLGLIAHRDVDYDDIGEKIGPIGWLSPEAMNKYLTQATEIGLDCIINEFSDIFQMGKLFWFIFQYNVPIGQIQPEDFTYPLPLDNKPFIFELIEGMIQYSKGRRLSKNEIEYRIELLAMDFGI